MLIVKEFIYFPDNIYFENSAVRSRSVGVYFLHALMKKSRSASLLGIFAWNTEC